VRADCAKTDVVVPSLDAGYEQTFQKIKRPREDISIEKVISGLSTLRNEFAGQIWLEVFMVEGLNANAEQIAKIKNAIAAQLGQKCEVVADFPPSCLSKRIENNTEDVLSMLKRRPCLVNDIYSSLGINRNEALKYTTYLQNKRIIVSEQQDGITFFKALS